MFTIILIHHEQLISCADPMEWNCGNVQKWLLWTEHLYRLPQVGKVFQELSGKDLCSMTEEDFRQRSMQCGDLLYAHLDIWRSGRTTDNLQWVHLLVLWYI
jgi:hypothetical protein